MSTKQHPLVTFEGVLGLPDSIQERVVDRLLDLGTDYTTVVNKTNGFWWRAAREGHVWTVELI